MNLTYIHISIIFTDKKIKYRLKLQFTCQTTNKSNTISFCYHEFISATREHHKK